jgi:hypothetical protein
MKSRMRGERVGLAREPRPELAKQAEVGLDLALRDAFAGGADDDPARVRRDRLDRFAQPLPLLFAGDAPRDADLTAERQIHEVAPGQ